MAGNYTYSVCPPDTSLLPGSLQTGTGALAQHFPFKFRERPYHLHHHAPCRSSGVNRFGETLKSCLCSLYGFHENENIPKGAREAVEFPDDHDIALADLTQQAM